MKIYRFENKYHFGPFFSHFTEPYPTKDLPASDDLFDYDANISYRNKFGRSAPPSNYHVFGCTDKNQLIQDFKDHLDILSDSDFRISEYETDDFAYVDGVVCFDAVRSKLIHQYDVYGNMLNSMIANFDEFIFCSRYAIFSGLS